MRSPLPFVVVLAAADLLASGCTEQLEEDKPIAPDMSGLVDAYRTPTATLDQATLNALVEPLNLRLDVTFDLGRLDYVVADVVDPVVAEARDPDGAGEEPSDESPFGLEAEGFVRIRHVCGGPLPDAPPDAEHNGTLEMIMGFTEEAIDPVIWGDASACRFTIDEREVLLDGGVRFHLPEKIFWLFADVKVGDEDLVNVDFDFRVADGLELRLPVDDRDLIFFVHGDGVGFRAADGVWTCALAEHRCTRDDGAVLTVEGVSL